MSKDKENKLIFVYNATSGVITGIKDYFHKAFKPSTYQCNLCAVTYGTFGMKKEWKNFVKDKDVVPLKNNNVSFEFLHKDEFKEKYNMKDAKFPSAYMITDSGLELFISQDVMNNVKSIEELKELVTNKLKKFSGKS
ncbi:MAG: hypothetical protein ACFE8A_10435 [Candidatus Hodarchaeota archaeon]